MRPASWREDVSDTCASAFAQAVPRVSERSAVILSFALRVSFPVAALQDTAYLSKTLAGIPVCQRGPCRAARSQVRVLFLWVGHTHFFVDALFGVFSTRWFTTPDLVCADVDDVVAFFKTFPEYTVHSVTVMERVIDWGLVIWHMGQFRKVVGTGGLSSGPRDCRRGPAGRHTSRAQRFRYLYYLPIAPGQTSVGGAAALTLRRVPCMGAVRLQIDFGQNLLSDRAFRQQLVLRRRPAGAARYESRVALHVGAMREEGRAPDGTRRGERLRVRFLFGRVQAYRS